ncbi:uncharacterized protein BDZ99DRAFT_443474 [Mytilinidion resinicola]|uniref:Zn(2)-C6 fungal-type domain-containing protein n=1 Tax=Mytilinidion resinicola TaxID=574789 RepID=A0A6A6YL46_9PEZI|nr:uncharacterized protein BDZ99DRAFT_443474 [Mytilinidion resinicola]KAF2809283.1 hypothetical protein BDZ99DRAFT_443474 [Mytilinidion resinicola]
MARAVASKEDNNTQSPVASSSSQAEQKTSKRRCVQSACVPCRKRKSKCDGGTPVCATCTAVYKTECHYDADSENRRGKTAVKRDSASIAETSSGAADIVVASIRSLPESEIQDIIHQIRRDDNLDSLAESLRRVVTLPPKLESQTSSLEGDLAVLIGKPALTKSGVSRHYGHTSSLGLVREDENYTQPNTTLPAPPNVDTWTTVTSDTKFLYHLFELYFKWSHPFYVLFSRECFYKDFRTGRQKYCSPLLVNAICAYACHSSDEPLARTDPSNPRTAGDHFFAEARRLLFEDESPRLTTVQALAVMGLREPSAGRDSSGFMYAGRCMRMAVELGLHLNYSSSANLGLTRSEIEVRKVTFWGCFTFDTAWSLAIGRISQLPRTAINLDKPILEEPVALEKGQLFLDASRESQPVFTNRQFLQGFSTLSELVSDSLFMFYAPRERFTSRRLLDTYCKYKNWYKSLPKALQLDPNDKALPIPHVLTLHMYYHTCIVHLFRPLMKVDILHSDIRPREVCIDSANTVSDIMRLYRRHYSLRSCNLLLTHILLSITTVHLINSSNPVSRRNLIDGLRAMEDMSTCHYFTARTFKIIYNLCQKWNLPFPDELKSSPLVPVAEPPLTSPPPRTTNFFDNYDAIQPPNGPQPPRTEYPSATPEDSARRESLTMFTPQTLASASSSLPPRSSTTTNTTSPPLTFASSPNNAQGPAAAPAEEQLFWTPFQGQGVPLLGNNMHVSPMDLSSMLGAVDQWDDFSRDGFKMSESWQQAGDQMGFVGQGAHGHGMGVAGVGQGAGGAGRMGTAGGAGFAEWWGNAGGNGGVG